MLGYIVSDKETINVEEHEIQSFDILHKTNLNIFVVENNKVLYKNEILMYACIFGDIKILSWFKNSGYDITNYSKFIYYASGQGHVKVLKWFKKNYELICEPLYLEIACSTYKIKILKWFKKHCYFKYSYQTILNVRSYDIFKFFLKHIHVKKVIRGSKKLYCLNIKFKTKNNYIKGYNKN